MFAVLAEIPPTFMENAVMSVGNGIVGGVCMAHAPQFFTLPDSEDKDTVERVRRLAAENGEKLRALNPDVTLIVANDSALCAKCTTRFDLRFAPAADGARHGPQRLPPEGGCWT